MVSKSVAFQTFVFLILCFRVEDHDDLTPIFNRQSDMLKTTYGDYFLAELIESQDEDNHAIIVEVSRH